MAVNRDLEIEHRINAAELVVWGTGRVNGDEVQIVVSKSLDAPAPSSSVKAKCGEYAESVSGKLQVFAISGGELVAPAGFQTPLATTRIREGKRSAFELAPKSELRSAVEASDAVADLSLTPEPDGLSGTVIEVRSQGRGTDVKVGDTVVVARNSDWDFTNRRLNGIMLLKAMGPNRWESLVYPPSTAVLSSSERTEVGIDLYG